MHTATVTNFKISVKCVPVSLDSVVERALEQAYTVKKNNNFVVLKREFCCSLFKRKLGCLYNHVNITKIKSRLEIAGILKELEKVGVYCQHNLVVIDNITGQLNTQTKVDVKKLVTTNLQSVINEIANSYSIVVRYNNEKFPGAFLKIFEKGRKLGTSIIFHSGKIVFVGSKCEEDLQCLSQLTCAIIRPKY